MATRATVEGDATAHLISELCNKYSISGSLLARGMPVGGGIEYVDATTLSQAFSKRLSY